jgi:hypothetical protein
MVFLRLHRCKGMALAAVDCLDSELSSADYHAQHASEALSAVQHLEIYYACKRPGRMRCGLQVKPRSNSSAASLVRVVTVGVVSGASAGLKVLCTVPAHLCCGLHQCWYAGVPFVVWCASFASLSACETGGLDS